MVHFYLGHQTEIIKSDGKGYYDYLPSIFIHDDIYRYKQEDQVNARVKNLTIAYVPYEDGFVNKYPCGTALLELPFFLVAHFGINHDTTSTGYEGKYHRAIYYAVILYLILGLLFFKKLLRTFNISSWTIRFLQLLLVLATPILHYTYYDGSYSHIYSFFAVTAFWYFIRQHFLLRKRKHVIYAALFLGLITIIRQVNVLVILFIPFLTLGFPNFIKYIKELKVLDWALALFIVLIICSIQGIIWYLQSGSVLIYSYQGETFEFLKPKFFKVLFSYETGLFIYTPLLFFAFLSVFNVWPRHGFNTFLMWVIPFLIVNYIFSSWHSWTYGACFSLRPYVEYISIFMIPLAILLQSITLKKGFLLGALLTLSAPLNIVQTYQYKNYIIHWWTTTKEQYWKVFLRTEKEFEGYVWKTQVDESQFEKIGEDQISEKDQEHETFEKIHHKILDPELFKNSLQLIKLSLDNDFDDKDKSRIALAIRDSLNKDLFWFDLPTLHCAEKEFGSWHTGHYYFKLNDINIEKGMFLEMHLETLNQPKSLKNIKLEYFSKK
ncbi:MAG: hypothetical protein MRY83_16785 [Flavobacteriales bacterium]|nr:hypothetical protein [Flavobacteriales bacterium]